MKVPRFLEEYKVELLIYKKLLAAVPEFTDDLQRAEKNEERFDKILSEVS